MSDPKTTPADPLKADPPEAPKADPPKPDPLETPKEKEADCVDLECVSCKAKYNAKTKTWTVPGKAPKPPETKPAKKTVWEMLGLH